MIYYVCGKRGSGKTHYVIHNIIPRHTRVIILDSLGYEYNFLGYKISKNFEQFKRVFNKNINKDFFRLVYIPFDDKYQDFFRLILKSYDNLIIIEESDLYCTPYNIDQSLEKLIKYGRHRGIDLCFVSRRPSEVNRLITSQANIIIVFNTTEPRDITYLKYFDKNINKKLKDLKDFEYIELSC